MTQGNNVYARLSERLGAPGSGRFVKVLEAMVTPEEAGLLLELQKPASCKELASRLNTDESILQKKLDAMKAKGIVNVAEQGYIGHRNIVMFHHMAHSVIPEELKHRIYPLWEDFFWNEWRGILVDEFERRTATTGARGHRVVPASKALDLSPNIRPEQILWYEDMRQMIARGKKITSTACGCRVIWGKCDATLHACVHIDNTRMEALAGKRSDVKELSKEEALALNDATEEKGLVHIPLNIIHAEGTICNCCEDCCMVINPMFMRGRVHELLSPSRYRAVIDQEKCQGCQTCIDRCIFDAIEMRKPAGSKKMKAYIINEHCMGCGACVFKCPNQAMHLELVRPPSHIPEGFPESSGRRIPVK
jgi:ferredoxin